METSLAKFIASKIDEENLFRVKSYLDDEFVSSFYLQCDVSPQEIVDYLESQVYDLRNYAMRNYGISLTSLKIPRELFPKFLLSREVDVINPFFCGLKLIIEGQGYSNKREIISYVDKQYNFSSMIQNYLIRNNKYYQLSLAC